MRGGQKPKPIALQIAEGDPRMHGVHKLREMLEREPKPRRGLPGCPSHLKGRARAAWNSWKEDIEIMDIDRRPDAVMLEGACTSYARAVEADLILARDGITIEESVLDEESGEKIVLRVKKHPAVDVSNRAWSQVRAFCTEFGFSPASRTRVATDKKPDAASDLAAILNTPRVEREKPTSLQ